MNNMNDIPSDVMTAARASVVPEYDKFPPTHRDILSGEHDDWPIVRVAARAIMAERERIAAQADEMARIAASEDLAVFAGLIRDGTA